MTSVRTTEQQPAPLNPGRGEPTRASWHTLPFDVALQLGAESWEHTARCTGSPFQTREWQLAWSAAARDARADAFVLARRDERGAMHEILPLARRPRRIGAARAIALTWASDDIGCPDHLEIPAANDQIVDEIAEQLVRLDWDVLSLRNLREDAPRAARLAARFAEMGLNVRVGAREPCPTLTLPASWEEYLAKQSSTRRQTTRRKERKLTREHEIVIRDYDASSIDDGWKVLGALHSERWGGATAFTPGVAEMHRQFAKSLAARNALWLTALELDGVAVAAWYGFAEGDTVFFFQGGRSLDHEQESVGQVLMGMMIRRAIERGFRRFDFLRGDEPYKASWTSEQRSTWEMVVTRPGARGTWLRAHQSVASILRLARARAGSMLRARRSR
jgi:CelD/BcsL family acetyltransferase involved in cellulose biosynthesis